MKYIKRVFFFVLVFPLVLVFGPLQLLESACYILSSWLDDAARFLDNASRTSKFDGWVSWAKKISKID